MQSNLTLLRNRINELDEQLVKLLNERADVALQIGELKAKEGLKVYDPSREGAVLEHVTSLNDGPLNRGAIQEIFATIITACREMQSNKLLR